MKLASAMLVCVALVSTGCATTSAPSRQSWSPLVDMKGVDQARYQQDLGECRTLAAGSSNTDKGQAQKSGLMRYGAIGAAATGLAVVATGGLALLPVLAGTAATSVGGSALMGGYVAGEQADTRYKVTINSCLAGRGYSIVDAGY